MAANKILVGDFYQFGKQNRTLDFVLFLFGNAKDKETILCQSYP